MQPGFCEFARAYRAGTAQAAWTTMDADVETPVSAMLKLGDGEANCFLLESRPDSESRERYSIIGAHPDVIWRAHGSAAQISRQGGDFAPCSGGVLDSLRALLEESRIALPPDLPPMAAGVFGYMAYDTVRLMERLPPPGPDAVGVPDGIFLRPTLVAVFDSITDTITLVTPVRPEAGVDAEAAHARAGERLARAQGRLGRPLPRSGTSPAPEPGRRAAAQKDTAPASGAPVSSAPVSNMSREDYEHMVRRAKDYIFAGDVFQVTLSQRFSLPFTLPPFALYRALRRINPSPFLFFLDFGDFALVGSSPEILVRLRAGTVTVRPIAGTHPKGACAAETARIGQQLLANPKERAEHLMLLDLGRNDAGRVSQIGSVRVTEQFALQMTSHLVHIVSNVEGQLAPEHDALSALIAGFPAGTVSGAPKIRAMEIIDELEPDKRGIYAGCVGYFSAAGDMDSCIALRTAVVRNGVMHVQAGGGIVADSVPASEFAESVNKAKALFRAAEKASRPTAA